LASSAGLSEAEYGRVTYDYTLAAANTLLALRAVFPNRMLSTTQIGTAMLNLAKHGYVKRVLEAPDIRIVSKV
jgi:hypothetical protein